MLKAWPDRKIYIFDQLHKFVFEKNFSSSENWSFATNFVSAWQGFVRLESARYCWQNIKFRSKPAFDRSCENTICLKWRGIGSVQNVLTILKVKTIYALRPENFCAWNSAERKVLTFCVSGAEMVKIATISFLRAEPVESSRKEKWLTKIGEILFLGGYFPLQ